MTTSSVDRGQNLLQNCVKELQSCVDYVQQYSENKEEHFMTLKDIAKQYCEIDQKRTRADQACQATDRHFDNHENDCTEDIQQIYNRYLEEHPNNFDYQNHPIWRKINNVIQGEKPDLSNCNEEESDIELDDNASIEEGIIPSQFEPPVDPITKKIIENPCRNRKCGHIYEYATIIDHLKKIRQNKSKPRCPYIGCSNQQLKATFIVKDDALKERIQHFIANRSNRNANDEEISSSNITL